MLEEILEQNIVLKVLEQELKQQEEISQKIYETLNSRVYRPLATRVTVVTQNAKPRIPKIPEAMLIRPGSSMDKQFDDVGSQSGVTKFPSIKRLNSKGKLQTNKSTYATFAAVGRQKELEKERKLA